MAALFPCMTSRQHRLLVRIVDVNAQLPQPCHTWQPPHWHAAQSQNLALVRLQRCDNANTGHLQQHRKLRGALAQKRELIKEVLHLGSLQTGDHL